MILDVHETEDDRRQFDAELEMIRVRCPNFVGMIRRSILHTAELTGNSEGPDLLKHSGAMRDLMKISRFFDEAPEALGPARNPEIEALFRTALV